MWSTDHSSANRWRRSQQKVATVDIKCLPQKMCSSPKGNFKAELKEIEGYLFLTLINIGVMLEKQQELPHSCFFIENSFWIMVSCRCVLPHSDILTQFIWRWDTGKSNSGKGVQGEITLMKAQMWSRDETGEGLSLIVAMPNLCCAAKELLSW